jgi:hypothetical protein
LRSTGFWRDPHDFKRLFAESGSQHKSVQLAAFLNILIPFAFASHGAKYPLASPFGEYHNKYTLPGSAQGCARDR